MQVWSRGMEKEKGEEEEEEEEAGIRNGKQVVVSRSGRKSVGGWIKGVAKRCDAIRPAHNPTVLVMARKLR